MPRRYLIVLILISTCATALAGEADPAADMPADAAVFGSVKDIRPAIAIVVKVLGVFDEETPAGSAAAALEQLRQVIAGRLSVALMPTSETRADTALLLRVPVDESKVKLDDLITKSITQFVGAENVESKTADGIRHLKSKRRRGELYWAVKDKVLYASNERALVAKRVLALPGPPARGLSETAAYKRLAKYVDWSADVTALCDFKTTFDFEREGLPIGHPFGLMGRAAGLTDWLALDQFEVAALSWKGDGKRGSGRLAVLTPGQRKGIAALISLPNVSLEHLSHLPETCQAFSASSLGAGLLARTAKFMSGLDPDVGKEFKAELAEFNKELGVDIGADLANNVGTMVSGFRTSDDGKAAVYNVAVVRDKAKLQKCLEALANYNKTPLRKADRGGRTYHTIPFKTPVHYAFNGDLVYFATTPEAIDEMFQLAKNGRTLADSEPFKALLKRLPRKSAFVWAVDVHWAAQMGKAATALVPDLREALPRRVIDDALEPLLKTPPGLSLGIALRNEPDAFVLHIEDPSGGAVNLIANVVKLATGAVNGARIEVRKVRSMKNLRLVGIAVNVWLVKKGEGTFYPPSLKALVDDGIIKDPDVFICPGSGTKPVEGQFVTDYDSVLERATKAGLQLSEKNTASTTMLAWEKEPLYGDGRSVVFFDCHVEWLPEAKFNQALQKLDKWIAEKAPRK